MNIEWARAPRKKLRDDQCPQCRVGTITVSKEIGGIIAQCDLCTMKQYAYSQWNKDQVILRRANESGQVGRNPSC
jgi:hypothetical protein